MSTTLQERPLASGACERLGRPRTDAIPLTPAPRFPVSLIVRYALVMMTALYLLFCHGCHRDEDNELFIRAAVGAAINQ